MIINIKKYYTLTYVVYQHIYKAVLRKIVNRSTSHNNYENKNLIYVTLIQIITKNKQIEQNIYNMM